MRHWMKKHWIVTAIFLVCAVAYGAKITEDTLRIGKPGSSGDKVIKMGDTREIRSNETGGFLEFTNDGSTYKRIGSGSGGASGVNVLAENNFDFEAGNPPTDWTASGGTLTSETTNQLFGDASGSWDSDALDQTLDSVLGEITEGFLGGTCQAEISYKYETGTAGDYQLIARQFDDSGATEIDVAVVDLVATGTATRKAQLVFDCPDDVADDLRVRIQSKVANADPIVIDDAFIGIGRNTFDISQAESLAAVYYPTTGGCSWDVTATGYTLVAAAASCPAPIKVSGSKGIDLSDNDRPNLTFLDGWGPGIYEIELTFQGTHGTGSNNMGWAIVETSVAGVLDAPETLCGIQVASGDTAMPVCRATVVVNDFIAAPTFDIQGFTSAGTASILNNGLGQTLQWNVRKFPLNSAEAITLETSGFYIESIWSHGSNFGLSLAVIAETSLATSSGVLTSIKGEAQVPCGSDPSTGPTCASSDERIGISFVAPTAGLYKICTEFSHGAQTSNGAVRVNWVLSRVTDGTDTVVEAGDKRFASEIGITSVNSFKSHPISFCESDYLSAGRNTYHLRRDIQSASGTVQENRIEYDLTSDANVRFTVEKITEQKPTPVFTDLQNSLNTKIDTESATQHRICAGRILGLTGTISSTTPLGGECLASATRNSVGRYSIIFNSPFATSPACSVTANSDYVSGNVTSTPGITGVDIRFYQNISNTDNDTNFDFVCIGSVN